MNARIKNQDLCNQFSVEQLTKILSISKSTARRYQNGTLTPKPPYVRLLDLEHRGRIMPDGWPSNVRFHGDKLSIPNTNDPLSWGELENYRWTICQWYHSMDMLEKLSTYAKKAARHIEPEVRERIAAQQPEKRPHWIKPRNYHRKHGC